MAYIIENANILKEQKLEVHSLLIKDRKIASIRTSFKKSTLMKMNANPFIMTPTHVMLDSKIPDDNPEISPKDYYIDNFIKKGCTAFLTYFTIHHEYQFDEKLKELKKQLLNSPIDFFIGVRIPLRLLTTSLIRKCKKEKVPAIFIEYSNVDELYQIPWGWIKEAMFPYNSPLIPVFKQEHDRERKLAKLVWKEIMAEQKVPSLHEEINEREPIHFKTLCKIGIVPLVSHLQQGSDISYNLYLKSREIRKIEESELFHYHNHRLLVTVHKETVIRAGEKVLYRPGHGNHVTIKTPSFYTS